ncbi:MAG TPA: AAA family ATPase, partial [Chloroflexi bacterium]|nr:AAA family ATPase [Chloroflexota bacterium]
AVPRARVAVFVGNAWDPQEGRETPWIDIARQLAGDEGVAALGAAARTTPPGTVSLGRLFEAAGGPVLVLFDEVLNFINRHRGLAEPFYAFIQNLTVAMTGTGRGAAVISLPRSQVEMTEWDLQWQERITKVVRRVAKDLIANDEAEIAEVVRRRLFEDQGNERTRKRVAKAFADWCFERRAQLPPEWTAVDTATTEAGARDYLQSRFEATYPFHPATLSVFQRKWQALPQYQQTRGTLAMLAQWISWAYREGFTQARREPLITLGSVPLDVADFRSVVLGQLGESRLLAAIDADIAGAHSHARALDADTKGALLRAIHRRVGAAILFESSGGQTDKIAHLPELRFALGEPEVDTTSIDTAALALESRAFYIRRVGTDGFQIRHQPTLKKVVSDRRASLDQESEIRPAIRNLVKTEFDRGRSIPIVPFPADGAEISDSPKLTLVVMDPSVEWNGSEGLRERLAEWTRQRGNSPRLYPGALVWVLKKPGRELRGKVEDWLAWKRVKQEIDAGTLGGDFDRTERAQIQTTVKEAEDASGDEVWASYRYIVLADSEEQDGLKVIDLGAGHASAGETLTGRVIAALKSQALLNESVGAGYLDRNWPPALKESGTWPLASLRQSFLNGALTRLLDPDTVLRMKVVEFVLRGELGLASGPQSDGGYERVWFAEPLSTDEVAFESGVFLLRKAKAQELRDVPKLAPGPVRGAAGTSLEPQQHPGPVESGEPSPVDGGEQPAGPAVVSQTTLRLTGPVPPEMWNRLGTRLIPKLRSGTDLTVRVEFTVTVNVGVARSLRAELSQILEDLGVAGSVKLEGG